MRSWPPGNPTFAGKVKRGFCVWFTGLPASGKTTQAKLLAQLLRRRACPVEILDGDELRRTLSRDLGFSRQDRDTHVHRVMTLAAAHVRAGRVVLCALVSPYRQARSICRSWVGPARFIEVFVDAPLQECQRRDPKGLYARARRGRITHFTGVNDPYEAPLTPHVVLDTWACSPEHNARRLEGYLTQRGFLPWR